VGDCATAGTASCRPCNLEDWARSQATPCGLCNVENGTRLNFFSEYFSFILSLVLNKHVTHLLPTLRYVRNLKVLSKIFFSRVMKAPGSSL